MSACDVLIGGSALATPSIEIDELESFGCMIANRESAPFSSAASMPNPFARAAKLASGTTTHAVSVSNKTQLRAAACRRKKRATNQPAAAISVLCQSASQRNRCHPSAGRDEKKLFIRRLPKAATNFKT